MIKIESVRTEGFLPALWGMRNPMNSHEKFDSCNTLEFSTDSKGDLVDFITDFEMGPNDHDLAMRLAKCGPVDAKYRRMMICYADITAPRYWWNEFDTYRFGVEKNSASTMHKIHAKEFVLEDFSWDQLLNTDCDLFVEEKDKGLFERNVQPLQLLTDYLIPALNTCREKFLETKDKRYWWQMIQLLPGSYNQKRTVMMSYEALSNMYIHRKDHKLDEWQEFCKFIKKLPYSEIITLEEAVEDGNNSGN